MNIGSFFGKLKYTQVGILFAFPAMLLFYACNEEHAAAESNLSKQGLDDRVQHQISVALQEVEQRLPNTQSANGFRQPHLLNRFYIAGQFKAVWSSGAQWLPAAGTVLQAMDSLRYYGLVPQHYGVRRMRELQQVMAADSLEKGSRLQPNLWAEADLLLTDAFLSIAWDLHKGRLLPDSIYNNYDSAAVATTVLASLNRVLQGQDAGTVFAALEPKHTGYRQLKKHLKRFVDTADLSVEYTWLPYPIGDSLRFVTALAERMRQGGWLHADSLQPGAAYLQDALRKLQQSAGLTVDGKYGLQVIHYLNGFSAEVFRTIALNLDRYKLLPDTLPLRYMWVNIPAYTLEIRDHDTVHLRSAVVVGRPATRTPLLTSAITNMVTYPQWTIPNSIILKEILPALRKDPGYLARKGYMLLRADGTEVNAYSVDWMQYRQGIPFKIVQGSGDANALGVMKFNFYNKYDVYLHDTNQRSLFKNDNRALSHGCVRVQQWKAVADYLLLQDSLVLKGGPNWRLRDSVTHWLRHAERRVVPLRTRIPVLIRYHTAAAEKDQLKIYPDIYGVDRLQRNRYL